MESISDLFTKGGWVMWPLLVLSLVALALAFERMWFWVGTNRPGRAHQVSELARLLRDGQTDVVLARAAGDHSVYGRVVVDLIDEPGSDAAASAAIEKQRNRLERFMPTLSTIITAAPMLGILGTVTGIIASFDLLSTQTAATDPRAVSGGIAEALLTTAAGLMVALVVLFPYNAYRAQIDRTLGRLELLIAALQVHAGRESQDAPDDEL